MNENEEKLIEVFQDTFDMDRDEINTSLSTDDIDKWDSINHLALVMNLEDAFKIKFSPEEIPKLSSFQDVMNMIQSKKCQN